MSVFTIVMLMIAAFGYFALPDEVSNEIVREWLQIVKWIFGAVILVFLLSFLGFLLG